MHFEIKQQDKFKFVEEGEGEPLDAAAWFIWCTQQFRRSDQLFQSLL